MSYEYPAWCQMETALDSYQQTRYGVLKEEIKKLGADGEKLLQRFNKAADMLIKGSLELAGIDVLGTLREVAVDKNVGLPFGKFLNEHIDITFGWEAMKMLSTARERFGNLLFMIQANRNPTPGAKKFLRRVARCYLFGFDNECLIMCRAVLDLEFKNKIHNGDVKKWWKTTDKGKEGKPVPNTLCARIQAAHHVRRIDEDTCKAAHKVRDDGNKAVHNAPSCSDALCYIKKTARVMDALASNHVK